MKSLQNIKKEASQLSEQDKKSLQSVGEELKMMIQHKKIDEETLIKLTNVITTLSSLKENYMWRILKAAKQNHMIN
jgi:hypothetical protein